MNLQFLIFNFCGAVTLVYCSLTRKTDILPESIEAENEEAFERMQLMEQAAIERYGYPHEIDYNFDPEK